MVTLFAAALDSEPGLSKAPLQNVGRNVLLESAGEEHKLLPKPYSWS